MCITGCAPFRAGNNFFTEIDKGLMISAEKYEVKTRTADVAHKPVSASHEEIEKMITEVTAPLENHVYQGLLIYVQHMEECDFYISPRLEMMIRRIQKKVDQPEKNLRRQIRYSRGEEKISLIAAFSKENNIKSYLCGNDMFRPFPYWFTTKRLSDFDTKSFDETITIIEAKSLNDVNDIAEIMKKGQSPCIFCTKELHHEARLFFNKTFPEYTWCVR